MADHFQLDDIHPGAIVLDSDPFEDDTYGPMVRAGILWVDKSGAEAPWPIKVRNAANNDWEDTSTPGGAGGGVVTLTFVIDGGGSPIAAGEYGNIVIDYPGAITSFTALGEPTATASSVFRAFVWRGTFGLYPPSISDLISPEITLGNPVDSLRATSFGSWTSTEIFPEDIIRFSVTEADVYTRVTLAIGITKT